MQDCRIFRVGGAAWYFPEIGKADFGRGALEDEEACWVGWRRRMEDQGADYQVGILWIASQEGGEGDGVLTEGWGDGYLDWLGGG